MQKEFYANNRKKVLEALPESAVAVFFAGRNRQRSEDDNFDYTANRNYYYLTGQKNSGGIVMLVKGPAGGGEYLFVERQTYRNKMYKGTFPSNAEYRERTLIENVLYLDEFESTVGGLMSKHGYRYLYGDFKRFQFDGTVDTLGVFVQKMRATYPEIQVCNVRPIICSLRRIKTPEEQEMMKRCGEMTVEAANALVKKIRPGLWTYALYAEFNYYLGVHYGEVPSFQSVITTGEDCLALHYFENYAEMQDGNLVLVDLGAEHEYYASDICRMYPVNGKFTETQRFFYQAVIEAEEAVAAALKPGFDMREIPGIADAVLAARLKEFGLIQEAGEIRRYLDHGIYHFVGLDAHDVGDDCVLEPGMVVSVEPGLYIPELALGVRVEDNFLITEDGNLNLTEKLAKYPDEIEMQMAANRV